MNSMYEIARMICHLIHALALPLCAIAALVGIIALVGASWSLWITLPALVGVMLAVAPRPPGPGAAA
jgi:hypothetical protein